MPRFITATTHASSARGNLVLGMMAHQPPYLCRSDDFPEQGVALSHSQYVPHTASRTVSRIRSPSRSRSRPSTAYSHHHRAARGGESSVGHALSLARDIVHVGTAGSWLASSTADTGRAGLDRDTPPVGASSHVARSLLTLPRHAAVTGMRCERFVRLFV